MNIPKLIAVLILAMLAACTDPPPPVVEDAVLPDYSKIVCKPSVHPFWAKFRDAVLKEDWEGVAGLTEFPLTIHRFDGDEKLIPRQDFAQQFPQFLNTMPDEGYPGVKLKTASMRELIRAIPTLHKKACGDFEEMLAIDNWQFFMRPEGWRLGRIDVHEFPTFMNHIPIQPIQIIKD